MFSRFFSKQKLRIFAPVSGEVLSLDDVPDPVFSQRMLGDGVAIMPSGGNILAPCSGTIIHLANTKHAIGLRTDDNTELLIHVGLETVSLGGQGFTACVKAGDKVEKGQLLLKVDWDFLQENAASLVTPLVITNSAEKTVQLEQVQHCEQGKTVLMTTFSN
ncbi:PTS sugar transporter subunit IIA [Psychrobacillus sp. FSL K6-1267]|uniref:PTS sugar transporter subunit IIA n=1 Tax=Psychrobacillus sp. FSL K6-1267 TaxID=2921543 RepID=UPI0030F921A1